MDHQSRLRKAKSPHPFFKIFPNKVHYPDRRHFIAWVLPEGYHYSFPHLGPFPHLDFEKERTSELAFPGTRHD